MSLTKGRYALHCAMRKTLLAGNTKMEDIEPLVIEAARTHAVTIANIVGIYSAWWRTYKLVKMPLFKTRTEAWAFHADQCGKLRQMIMKGKLLSKGVYGPVSIKLDGASKQLVSADPDMSDGVLKLTVSQEFGRVSPTIASAAIAKEIENALLALAKDAYPQGNGGPRSARGPMGNGGKR